MGVDKLSNEILDIFDLSRDYVVNRVYGLLNTTYVGVSLGLWGYVMEALSDDAKIHNYDETLCYITRIGTLMEDLEKTFPKRLDDVNFLREDFVGPFHIASVFSIYEGCSRSIFVDRKDGESFIYLGAGREKMDETLRDLFRHKFKVWKNSKIGL